MNVKNFIVCGIVGGIVDWILGWLFYGMLFKDMFPMDEATMNMGMITAGCFAVGFFIAYLFTGLTSVANAAAGLKFGAVIGLFQGLIGGFFENENTMTPDYQMLAMHIVLSLVMCAIVGGAVALVNGKMR